MNLYASVYMNNLTNELTDFFQLHLSSHSLANCLSVMNRIIQENLFQRFCHSLLYPEKVCKRMR